MSYHESLIKLDTFVKEDLFCLDVVVFAR
jgi:hypothetical protein